MPIIKKIPKKPRVSQKQKQRQSVNQTVVVNQQPATRRRGPNKPKAPSGGGSGSGGQGPSSSITYAPYQMTNAAPQSNQQEFAAEVARQVIRQSVPNIVYEIPAIFGENQRFYRNPFRLQPFRDDLNRENLIPVEVPLNNFDRAPAPPPPVEPDIVLQPNSIDQRSVSAETIPIHPNITVPQGFTSNIPANQLNEQIKAYKDFGGDDSQSVSSGAMSPLTPSTPLSRVERAYANLKGLLGVPQAIEIPRAELMQVGELIQEQDQPVLLTKKKSNKGRPFSDPTEEDIQSIDTYLVISRLPLNERNQALVGQTKILYKRGNRLLSQNKSNNPKIIAYAESVNRHLGKRG
jgi:hypothetical protein